MPEKSLMAASCLLSRNDTYLLSLQNEKVRGGSIDLSTVF
jgi:hypothetical protein